MPWAVAVNSKCIKVRFYLLQAYESSRCQFHASQQHLGCSRFSCTLQSQVSVNRGLLKFIPSSSEMHIGNSLRVGVQFPELKLINSQLIQFSTCTTTYDFNGVNVISHAANCIIVVWYRIMEIVADIGSQRQQGASSIVWQEVFDSGTKVL